MNLLLPLLACVQDKAQGNIDGDTGEPLHNERPAIPFGFWNAHGYQTPEGLEQMNAYFGSNMIVTAQEPTEGGISFTRDEYLPMIEEGGYTTILRLTGDHPNYTDTAGNFSVDMWIEKIEMWRDSGIQSYVDTGTFSALMMIDDIYTFSGNPPSAEDLELMACTSQDIFPGLMALVRVNTLTLPEGDYSACPIVFVNQYTNYPGYSDGPVDDYARDVALKAQESGVEYFNGLNIADGGDCLGENRDGVDVQPGVDSRKCAMTGREIREYGLALMNPNIVGLSDSYRYPLGFASWKYSDETFSDGARIDEYFSKPDLQEALAYLGELTEGDNP